MSHTDYSGASLQGTSWGQENVLITIGSGNTLFRGCPLLRGNRCTNQYRQLVLCSEAVLYSEVTDALITIDNLSEAVLYSVGSLLEST